MSPLRPLHWFVFVLVGVLFFIWGVWLMQARQAEPLPWLLEWDQRLLQSLADDSLNLDELHATVDGELWLQARLDRPRLLYRAEVPAGQLEAELELSQQQRESLASAVGAKPGDAEQPLSRQMAEDLGQLHIASITIMAGEPLDSERLIASLGQPSLRLELAEGQAWVYPQRGLTAHLQDDEVQLLHIVPRRALRQP